MSSPSASPAPNFPIEQLESHRSALLGHCYRMLGSSADAEDATQEALLRGWKSLGSFDRRSSLRTWLYRIATNVCLDLLNERARRYRPQEERPAGSPDTPASALSKHPREHWLEPVPDVEAIPSDEDPAKTVALRQSIRLAFVAALQHLPPKQRAALLLADVLEFSAAEIAETLSTTAAAVNSALQRARATMAEANLAAPESLSNKDAQLLERFVHAFERYDVSGLAALLSQDVVFSMPPYSLWLQGPAAVQSWLLGTGRGCRGSKVVPTRANDSPAFAQYRSNLEGGYHAWALIVLETRDGHIAGWTSFLEVATLFPKFGMPLSLPS